MNAYIHVLRTGLLGLALLGSMSGPTSAAAQSFTPEETVRSVGRMLERLPYYGVFDYIVFRVDGGTVYLAGYSFEGRLKADAEMAAKRANGVNEVANKIEVLPASQNDDRIRWATFYRIYTDDFLSRYAPGGEQEVLRELQDERQFPGMQPVGIYPTRSRGSVAGAYSAVSTRDRVKSLLRWYPPMAFRYHSRPSGNA